MLLHGAALAALIASCAPPIAERDLVTFARNESGGDTFAIHDNKSGEVYHVQDAAKTIAIARELLAKPDASIDLGLMQINSRNLSWLGLTIEDAFDGCSSVRAASQLLTHVSEYNTGSPTRGFKNRYVAKFIASRQNAPSDTPAAEAPPAAPAPPERHVWHDSDGHTVQPPRRHEWHESKPQSPSQIEASNEH
jgi:type IV secretion system protein VirB1